MRRRKHALAFNVLDWLPPLPLTGVGERERLTPGLGSLVTPCVLFRATKRLLRSDGTPKPAALEEEEQR